MPQLWGCNVMCASTKTTQSEFSFSWVSFYSFYFILFYRRPPPSTANQNGAKLFMKMPDWNLITYQYNTISKSFSAARFQCHNFDPVVFNAKFKMWHFMLPPFTCCWFGESILYMQGGPTLIRLLAISIIMHIRPLSSFSWITGLGELKIWAVQQCWNR